MAKTKKNIYKKNYKSEDLERAVSAVRAGMSVRKAEQEFKVPKATIQSYHTRPRFWQSWSRCPSRKTSSHSYWNRGVVKSAKTGQLVNRLKLKTPFKNGILGIMWWRGLKSRFPEMVIRKPEKLSTVRSRMMNREVVAKYFQALDQTIKSLDLQDKPECIWNSDEKGFQFEHSPVSVCARKGSWSWSLPGRISNSRESVSVWHAFWP